MNNDLCIYPEVVNYSLNRNDNARTRYPRVSRARVRSILIRFTDKQTGIVHLLHAMILDYAYYLWHRLNGSFTVFIRRICARQYLPEVSLHAVVYAVKG